MQGFDLQTRAPGAQFAVSEAFSGPSGQWPWRAVEETKRDVHLCRAFLVSHEFPEFPEFDRLQREHSARGVEELRMLLAMLAMS